MRSHFKKKQTEWRWSLLFFSFFTFQTTRLDARFQHEDSLELDPRENTSPELFNDLISYRYPVSWDNEWKQAGSGMRTSAGSLDIRRFSYLQEVKLTSPPQKDLVFSFQGQREENPLFQKRLQEIRVTKKADLLFDQWTLLGDCGFEKEYGDLGFEVQGKLADILNFSYKFWAVDLYYNSKKEAGEDHRSKNPLSHELDITLLSAPWGSWDLWGQIDTPVDWVRLSRGYRYRSNEGLFGMRLVFPKGSHPRGGHQKWEPFSRLPNDQLTFAILKSQKHEDIELLDGVSKNGLLNRLKRPDDLFPPYLAGLASGMEGLYVRQNINRSTFEISFNQRIDARDLISGGLFLHQEKTARSYGGAQEGLPEALRVPQGSEEIHSDLIHNETAFYGFYVYADRKNNAHFWHHGVAANHQKNNHLFNRESYEVKYIAAFEMSLSKEARFYLNSTWDLDQLAYDAPFTKRSFRPWGGGNLQGIIVF